jgi:hypothetical protein
VPLLVVLAVILDFTITPYECDSLGSCEGLQLRLERIAKVRLYGAPRWSDGMPRFVRERPASVGPDTLRVEDAGGWTYWVGVVDSAGNVLPTNCLPVITVGVPTVGVDPGSQRRDGWFDLRGARLESRPTRPGVYWYVEHGKKPRKIRVRH